MELGPLLGFLSKKNTCNSKYGGKIQLTTAVSKNIENNIFEKNIFEIRVKDRYKNKPKYVGGK